MIRNVKDLNEWKTKTTIGREFYFKFKPIGYSHHYQALDFLYFIPLLNGNMVKCFNFRVRPLKSQTCHTDVFNI